MPTLRVERLGGLANFGGARSHVRSRGQVELASLSPADQKAIRSLFGTRRRPTPAGSADLFRYRLDLRTASGDETIEVGESDLPAAVTSCVKDELV